MTTERETYARIIDPEAWHLRDMFYGCSPVPHWLGKRSPNASLPDETVLAIRSAQGSWADIARRFGVSKTVVGRIIQRKTYSDV